MVVPDISRQAVSQLKKILGKRRFQIAMMRFGRNFTQEKIAGRLGVSRRMVRKDLAKIERQFGDIRRRLTGDEESPDGPCWQLMPSLN